MKRRFPVKRKALPSKAASCEAMALGIKPFTCRVRKQIVPFPKPSRDGIKTYPVILNFPVRAL